MAPFCISLSSLAISAAQAVATGLTYLLRTAFSGVSGQPVTLTNGQVLDTTAEGLVTGSLTVADTSSAALQIASNKLSTTAANNNTYTTLGIVSNQLAAANGRILKFLYDSGATFTNAHETLIGFKAASGVNLTSPHCAFYLRGGGAGLIQNFNGASNSLTIGGVMSLNTTYEFAIVEGSSAYYMFVKGGSFSTWTLIFVEPTTPSSNYFYAITGYTIPGISSVEITETLYPNLVQAVAEDTFTETSDTALTSHPPEKGGAWAITRDYASAGATRAFNVIGASDVARVDITAGSGWVDITAVQDSGVSDVLITCTATTGSSTTGHSSVVALHARSDGTDWAGTGDTIRAYANDTSNVIEIAEYNNGSGAVRGSTAMTLAASTAYALQLRVIGSSVTFTCGGTTVVGTLGYTIEPHTKHGIEGTNVAGSTGAQFDNFKVYPAIAKQVSGTTVAEDSFTDTNGTLLTNHTPTKGSAWLQYKRSGTGDIVVDNNTIKMSSAGSQAVGFMSTGEKDVLLEADWFSGAGTYTIGMLVARATFNAGDYYDAVVAQTINNWPSLNDSLRIVEYNAGVVAVRGAVVGVFADNSTYKVSTRVVGTSVTVSANGTSISATIAANNDVDTHGMEMFYATSGTTSVNSMDNFKIYPFVELNDYDEVLDAI